MAGDWIKMRLSLGTHPKVMRMAEALIANREYCDWAGIYLGIPGNDEKTHRYDALRVTRYVTVGALLRYWGYANEHLGESESIEGLWPDDVDQIAGVPGFSLALETVGWIFFDAQAGAANIPNFNKYNVVGANRGMTNAERQKAYRERKRSNENVTVTDNVTRNVTSNAREEKRREEITTPIPPSGAFLRFWAAWPKGSRKKSQGKCWEVWSKKDFDQVSTAILAHVASLKASDDWQRGYVCAPLVYLNQRQWEGAEAEEPQAARVAL